MDKGSSQLFEKMAIEGHYCPLKRLTEDTCNEMLNARKGSILMLQKQRSIRVLVSSTFRDMQAERDYLVLFVFLNCVGMKRTK